MLAPTDTRKGLIWRAITGGALLTWTLLHGLTMGAFIALHLSVFLIHRVGNVHDFVYMTFGLAVGGLIPTSLLLMASGFCLWGRGWPRAFAGLGAILEFVWAIATVLVFNHAFVMQKTALYGVIIASAFAVVTLVWTALLMAGGQWVSKSAPGKPARAVPYALWAGPMIVVLGSLAIMQVLVSVVRVAIEYAGYGGLEIAAERVFYAYPLFWGAVATLPLSFMLIVSGIALLRRSRWAVGLGGAAGIFQILLGAGTVVALYAGSDIRRVGGPALALVHVFAFLAYGIAGWVGLAGAIRYGFRLPSYLRDASNQGADGKRRSLLEVLVPSTRPSPPAGM